MATNKREYNVVITVRTKESEDTFRIAKELENEINAIDTLLKGRNGEGIIFARVSQESLILLQANHNVKSIEIDD